LSGTGGMRERVKFEQKALDANGDRLGAWDGDGDGFDVAAEITWLRKGEAVTQGRIEGQSPVIIKVWSSEATRAVTTAWRAVDMRTGGVYNLQTKEPVKDRQFREFLAIANGDGGGA